MARLPEELARAMSKRCVPRRGDHADAADPVDIVMLATIDA